ncbi:MAG TPA: helix-turn-helix domain-containing protein [Candidatus Saccharimonadales bacterium]
MDNSLAQKRADAQRNYDKLLQTAATILRSQTTIPALESIAKRAGVGIGTLYRHFPTKKSLLEAVYAQAIAVVVGEASKPTHSAPPDKVLTDWLTTIVDYSAKYNGFSDFISLSLDDKESEIIKAGAHLLTQAQRAGAVRRDLTASELLRLVQAVTDEGAEKQTARARKLLSIIISGLRIK